MHDVTKSFGARRVLDGVELAVMAGEIVVVRGANGAGKSTLLDVATHVLSADSGEITVDGDPIAVPRARRGIGYAPAHPLLPDSLAAHELVDLLCALHHADVRRIDRSFARFGVDAFADVRVCALSLGQRRRVLLTVADAVAERVLVLDEPTVGLDREGVTVLVECIAQHRARGAAVLIATHDADWLGSAPRTVTLAAGRIAA